MTPDDVRMARMADEICAAARKRAAEDVATAIAERDKWAQRRLVTSVILMVAVTVMVMLIAARSFAQTQPVCRPGPAGSIICETPTTAGSAPATPSYVAIVSEPAAPPQLGPNQNALTYRASIRDYCLRNLRGCGPGR